MPIRFLEGGYDDSQTRLFSGANANSRAFSPMARMAKPSTIIIFKLNASLFDWSISA